MGHPDSGSLNISLTFTASMHKTVSGSLHSDRAAAEEDVEAGQKAVGAIHAPREMTGIGDIDV